MPTSHWKSLQVRQPEGITALGNLVTSGLSTVKTLLQTIRLESQIASARFRNPADLSTAALNAAIQAAVRAADEAVASLLDDTGGYMLMVPIPKKGLVQLVPTGDPEDEGSNLLTLPMGSLIEQLPREQQARLQGTSVFEQLTDPTEVYRGGNAYFVRTVGESLHDANDSSRPKFGRDDYWAYALMVAGAEDLSTALTLVGFLDRLLGAKDGHGTGRGLTSFVPQNVRAMPSGRGRTVVLEWDPVAPSRLLASYDGSVVNPIEFAVIRSTDFRCASARSVSDLFGSPRLTIGQTGNFGTKVVDVRRFDGVTNRWNETEELDPTKEYHYIVAFRSRITPPGSAPEQTEMDYDKLVSAPAVKVRQGRPSPTHGQPPDWVRIPSFATIFPSVERLIDMGLEKLHSFARGAQTVSDVNDAFIQKMQDEINRYTTLAEEFARRIETVTDLLTRARSIGGLAVKTGTGHGSVADFFVQIASDFSDVSDPERPAFDAGDEYVMGVVLLAVGPNPEAIFAQLAMFEQLFGSPEVNELLAGINSIGDQLAIAEAAVAAEEAAATTFNDDMTPRAPGRGDASCDPPVTPIAPILNAGLIPEE